MVSLSGPDPNPSSSPSSSTAPPLPVRSVRTFRSNPPTSPLSQTLTDSTIDSTLIELTNPKKQHFECDSLNRSRSFSEFSVCSSDISGELQRLASLPSFHCNESSDLDVGTWLGFLQQENIRSEIFDSVSNEDLEPAVRICVEGLKSCSVSINRSAAANLRVLAKSRTENRALIGSSGAIPALIPLLRSSDSHTQEHVVTALLNLSLHEENKVLIIEAGAIKPLVYALKVGTETSKQNAACALTNISVREENKILIGACGAIPHLVSLILNGSNRSKKDALTTLYKLCSMKLNKERAVNAGTVKPLVEFVMEQRSGLADKAMVVLSSLAGVEDGKVAIVEEGGIPALVEAIEDGSVKGKEFAVLTLLQLCAESVRNRGLLVREGGIPPLVALSQTGTARAKHKAETLLGYLREPRPVASSSC